MSHHIVQKEIGFFIRQDAERTYLGIIFVSRVFIIIPINNWVKPKLFTYSRICHSLNTPNPTSSFYGTSMRGPIFFRIVNIIGVHTHLVKDLVSNYCSEISSSIATHNAANYGTQTATPIR